MLFRSKDGSPLPASPGQVVANKLANAITVGFTIFSYGGTNSQTGQGNNLGGVAKDSLGKDHRIPPITPSLPATGRRVGWREVIQ